MVTDEDMEKELILLREAVDLIYERAKSLASCINREAENGEADSAERLLQITVALNYETEVLKAKISALLERQSKSIDSYSD